MKERVTLIFVLMLVVMCGMVIGAERGETRTATEEPSLVTVEIPEGEFQVLDETLRQRLRDRFDELTTKGLLKGDCDQIDEFLAVFEILDSFITNFADESKASNVCSSVPLLNNLQQINNNLEIGADSYFNNDSKGDQERRDKKVDILDIVSQRVKKAMILSGGWIDVDNFGGEDLVYKSLEYLGFQQDDFWFDETSTILSASKPENFLKKLKGESIQEDEESSGISSSSSATPSTTDCTTQRCRELDAVWKKISVVLDLPHINKFWNAISGKWEGHVVVVPPTPVVEKVVLSEINIPDTKISPGYTIIDLKSLQGFTFKGGVDSQGTLILLNALQEMQNKANEYGFTKEIVITDALRTNSGGHSHHNSGNAVDIRTNDLNLNERLILIRAAIETGFGEVYHGSTSGAQGLNNEENNQLQCFWLENHGDHLHIALEDKTQPWENCITPKS